MPWPSPPRRSAAIINSATLRASSRGRPALVSASAMKPTSMSAATFRSSFLFTGENLGRETPLQMRHAQALGDEDDLALPHAARPTIKRRRRAYEPGHAMHDNR